MKMLIEKNILLEGLNFVSRALSTRNIIPVLNGIKFDLKKEGLLIFEIGYKQKEDVSNILIENKFKNIKCMKDLQGLDRVIIGEKE